MKSGSVKLAASALGPGQGLSYFNIIIKHMVGTRPEPDVQRMPNSITAVFSFDFSTMKKNKQRLQNELEETCKTCIVYNNASN